MLWAGPLRVWMEPGAERWFLWGPLPALWSSTPQQPAGPALARGLQRGAPSPVAPTGFQHVQESGKRVVQGGEPLPGFLPELWRRKAPLW